MLIRQIFISSGHNFVGHYGQPPGSFPLVEVSEVECVAGRGLRGDRYLDFRKNYKGQITFFSLDVFNELCAALDVHDCSPAAARRNVITRGIDLNRFIHNEFEIQGVRFYGTEESAPCYWMDRAFAPGAQVFLKGNGGLRARILSDGKLHSTALVPSAVA